MYPNFRREDPRSGCLRSCTTVSDYICLQLSISCASLLCTDLLQPVQPLYFVGAYLASVLNYCAGETQGSICGCVGLGGLGSMGMTNCRCVKLQCAAHAPATQLRNW